MLKSDKKKIEQSQLLNGVKRQKRRIFWKINCRCEGAILNVKAVSLNAKRERKELTGESQQGNNMKQENKESAPNVT